MDRRMVGLAGSPGWVGSFLVGVQAGALTFLFTDIEASTRRWEADAPGMSTALADDDKTLQAAIAAAGGTAFKHTGDGMCAVFPSATAGAALGVDEALSLALATVRSADDGSGPA